MDFQESVNYLLSLGNEVSAMKLGLENIRKLLTALGDPQNNYLKVQVAGTNGKGSVCAFLNSICLTAGIKTGMYTSPHLISITERIQIDGGEISQSDFAKLATRVREVSERLVVEAEIDGIPTFFEQATATALLAFADSKVELAILETGLGGRLDATTAANAEIAAITRIDLDHQQYLGETIEEIAAEKAEIIHEGSRVVIGEQKPEAMKVILERCKAFGVQPGLGHLISSAKTVRLGLLGRHQMENAQIAMLLAEVLRETFEITNEQIVTGVESARHPGRIEFDGQFLFDGAHNAGGASALKHFLDESVQKPITMIFGSMNDKSVKEIVATLYSNADKLILTPPDNSRAIPPADIVELLPEGIDAAKVFVTRNVSEALDKAREVTGENEVILVTGSLYLVGEVKRILQNGQPPETDISNLKFQI
ncbi:MAG: folylpolyglutamate synthase/dihydrofolate synthase family protein [Pyrinomonadaceae bacterium]